MEQLIQIVGALMVLAAFVLVQSHRTTPRTRLYLVLNALGGGVLAYDAAVGREWGFLLLEGTWALVALWSLVLTLRRRTPDPPP